MDDLSRTLAWTGARLAFSGAGLFTIHHMCEMEGHPVSWGALVIISVIAVIGIRLWMPLRDKE